jgi:hypothetical protein
VFCRELLRGLACTQQSVVICVAAIQQISWTAVKKSGNVAHPRAKEPLMNFKRAKSMDYGHVMKNEAIYERSMGTVWLAVSGTPMLTPFRGNSGLSSLRPRELQQSFVIRTGPFIQSRNINIVNMTECKVNTQCKEHNRKHKNVLLTRLDHTIYYLYRTYTKPNYIVPFLASTLITWTRNIEENNRIHVIPMATNPS